MIIESNAKVELEGSTERGQGGRAVVPALQLWALPEASRQYRLFLPAQQLVWNSLKEQHLHWIKKNPHAPELPALLQCKQSNPGQDGVTSIFPKPREPPCKVAWDTLTGWHVSRSCVARMKLLRCASLHQQKFVTPWTGNIVSHQCQFN